MADIAELSVSIGADIKELKTKMSQVESQLKGTQQTVNKFGNSFKEVGGIIAGALSVGAIIGFGKEVIAITAEFQKFEAVLTNSLGSNSAAQAALQQIQEFAAQTPFSVRELTEAYVQLANRGITPSTDTLRAMGDVAAALGKPLQQVNEAILDVTNSERWNELGIKVKVNGDKISGTFRGMTVEAERSEAGAMKLVETFGKMEGVAGGMAMVSETLGGRISNLGDSFDQLYATIGGLTEGPITWFIESVNEMVNATTRLIKSNEQLRKESHLKTIGKEAEEVQARLTELASDFEKLGQSQAEAQTNAYKQIREELENLIATQTKQLDIIARSSDDVTDRDRLDAIAEEYRSTKELIEINEARLASLDKIVNKTTTETAAVKAAAKEKEKYTGLLAIEKAKLEELEAARMNASTANEIGNYNELIEKQKELIANLEEYSLKRTEAFSSADPKGFDTKTAMVPTTELPTTWSQQFYADLGKEIDIVTAKNQVFGESFNLVAAKADILTGAIESLLENGISPTHPMIESLKLQLDSLGETFQQITIDVGGMTANLITDLATAFGELAIAGGNVDDFGKAILGAMFDFVGQLGKMMIATGIASEALKNVLSNPYAAIAAGAVLVGLAAGASALLKRGPTGGGSTQGRMVQAPNLQTNPKVKNVDVSGISGPQELEVTGEFKIRNDTLVASIAKQQANNKRMGR